MYSVCMHNPSLPVGQQLSPHNEADVYFNPLLGLPYPGYLLDTRSGSLSGTLLSDIAIFVLKRDVKLQLTNYLVPGYRKINI